jgi:predicted DNA-binding protein with PD1-like motif
MRNKTHVIAVLSISISLVGVVWGERTRREVVKATTPEDDMRGNRDDVPEVISTSGQFNRVFIFRFKHQADLLAGLEKMVTAHRIRNAAILSGIGSVRNYQIHAVSNRAFPSKNIYIRDTESPADIVSMNGYVLDGRVHAHITLADEHHAFGGHLEPETNVFTFAIVTIAEFSDDVDLSRFDDKTLR